MGMRASNIAPCRTRIVRGKYWSMPPLTARLLRNFPYAKQADSGTLQRGRAYYKDGRVEEVDLVNSHTAICQVNGNSGDYEVRIQSDSSRNGLTFGCDCPFADGGNFCKHMVAAALELTDYLDVEDFDDEDIVLPASRAPVATTAPRKWQNKLGLALQSRLHRSSSHLPAGYVGLAILERLDYYAYSYNAYATGPES